MNSFTEKWQRQIDTAIIIGYGVIIWWLGYTRLGLGNTDGFSERNVISLLRHLVAHTHRFGLEPFADFPTHSPNGLTHYPNGPMYLLYPFYALGIHNLSNLRIIPMTIGIIGLCLLGFLLLRRCGSWGWRLYILMALTFVFVQPAVRDWMGALHEHSISLSIVFLIVGIAVLENSHPWLLLIIGFLSGWAGFDFLPGMVLAFFFVRLLVSFTLGRGKILELAKQIGLECFSLFSGILLAVFLHLIQNALYFNSFECAVRDLIGAGMIKIGSIEVGGQWNNPYSLDINSAPRSSRDISAIILAMFQSFLNTRWSYPIWILVSIGSVLLAWGYILGRCIVQTTSPFRCASAWLTAIAVSLLGSVVSSIAWFMLMPNHALPHFHFLPRHFIIGYLLLLLSPVFYQIRKNRQERIPEGSCAECTSNAFHVSLAWCCLVMIGPLGVLSGILYTQVRISYWQSLERVSTDARVFASASEVGNSTLKAPLMQTLDPLSLSRGGAGDPAGYWFSGPGKPLPQTWGVFFDKKVLIESIVMRFWSPDMQNGIHSPQAYLVESIDYKGSPLKILASYSSEHTRDPLFSFYNFFNPFIVHYWQLKEPIRADGIRIVFSKLKGSNLGGALISGFAVGGKNVPITGASAKWIPVTSKLNSLSVGLDGKRNIEIGEFFAGGLIYSNALKVQCPSRIKLEIGNVNRHFRAFVALDEKFKDPDDGVVFKVWADGQEIATSSALQGASNLSTSNPSSILETSLPMLSKVELECVPIRAESKLVGVVADPVFIVGK